MPLLILPLRRPQQPADILRDQYSGCQHPLALQWAAPGESAGFTLNQAEPAMLLPSNSLVVPANGPQVAAVENAAPQATLKNTMKKQ